jgi:hypothetical protein
MKLGFLVTSAINTRFGAFDTEQRLQQTIDTIKSIKARCKTAHITLIEMAAVPLTQPQKDEINKHVDVLIDFTNDDTVRRISLSDNWDIVKNATEMLCFKQALSLIKGWPDEYNVIDRFVKVSGRYQLNKDFKSSKFSEPDKVYFAKRKLSQFPPEVTGGCSEQFMSRCWSFPSADLDYVANQFHAMLMCMETILQSKGYVDIEHLLTLYTPSVKIVELDTIGVQGLLGPNGQQVKD